MSEAPKTSELIRAAAQGYLRPFNPQNFVQMGSGCTTGYTYNSDEKKRAECTAAALHAMADVLSEAGL